MRYTDRAFGNIKPSLQCYACFGQALPSMAFARSVEFAIRMFCRLPEIDRKGERSPGPTASYHRDFILIFQSPDV
jgi:hypothetical protein